MLKGNYLSLMYYKLIKLVAKLWLPSIYLGVAEGWLTWSFKASSASHWFLLQNAHKYHILMQIKKYFCCTCICQCLLWSPFLPIKLCWLWSWFISQCMNIRWYLMVYFIYLNYVCAKNCMYSHKPVFLPVLYCPIFFKMTLRYG